MRMTAGDVAKATKGKLVTGESGKILTGISTDTRTLKKGDLFVALRGEHHDGHDHLAQAFTLGAMGALIDRPESGKLPYPQLILTRDTLKGLGQIAHAWKSRFKAPIIAVTGSNGKTTTKDMIGCVLESRFEILKTEGNFNNWIGLPLTLFKLDKKHQKIILEMGMNHKGEIDWLAKIAEPEVGVITHIGRAHLENFKNQSGIARAKGELLKHLPKKGLAILNADDSYFSSLKKMAPCRIASFGFSPKAKARILSVKSETLNKTAFDVMIESQKHHFEIPLGGAHNAANAVAAILVGRHYGISFEKIKKALAHYQPEKKRMEALSLTQGIDVLNDSYNANPDSVGAAIDYLKGFSGRRRVIVLGDMFELGDNASELHREIGTRVAQSGIEKLIAVGPQSYHLVSGALEAGMEKKNIVYDSNVESALPHFPKHIQAKDLVLIKGSRGMKMERLAEALAKARAHA